MISKEEFIKLISVQKKWDNRLDEVGKILDCSPLDMDWVEYGALLFERVINILFDMEGVDDINWWLYEKPILSSSTRMWDANGNEIPMETVEDLWNVVKNYRK